MLLHGRTRRRAARDAPVITKAKNGLRSDHRIIDASSLTKYNRAVSCPSALEKKTSVKVISRLPGLSYYQPGVKSETVFGERFGECNERAQKLREGRTSVVEKMIPVPQFVSPMEVRLGGISGCGGGYAVGSDMRPCRDSNSNH